MMGWMKRRLAERAGRRKAEKDRWQNELSEFSQGVDVALRQGGVQVKVPHMQTANHAVYAPS